MLPRKQQGILPFSTRNNFSKVGVKQVLAFKFTTICKKVYVPICGQDQDERKTEKENLSGNTLKMLGTWIYCSSM